MKTGGNRIKSFFKGYQQAYDLAPQCKIIIRLPGTSEAIHKDWQITFDDFGKVFFEEYGRKEEKTCEA